MRRAGIEVGWVVAVAAGLLLACRVEPGYRTLHEVDGQVVSSHPPPPQAYEAYLRARLALDFDPPQLELAQHHIEEALRWDPRDPHLWVTRAEIEEHAGQRERAAASARQALALRPGYPPAERVLARVEGGGASQNTAAADP